MKSFQNTPRPLHQCCLLLFADYERLWSCIACVKEGGFSWPMISYTGPVNGVACALRVFGHGRPKIADLHRIQVFINSLVCSFM